MKKRGYALPAQEFLLDPVHRRNAQICDLFANQNRSLRGIAKHLQEGLATVVNVLIEEGFILDRRQQAGPSIREERRKSYFEDL